MRIADNELHAAQAASGERVQEFGPEGLCLGGTDRHPEHLAAAIGVDSNSDYDGNGDDPATFAHFDVGRVDPEIRPNAFDGALQEGLHALIDLFAKPRDLAFGDASHAESDPARIASRDPLALTSSSAGRVDTPCT